MVIFFNLVKTDYFMSYGRSIKVPKAADGIALFTFDELCGNNGADCMGPAEYLHLASIYNTIIVQSVPQMGVLEVNEARRFITFIDAVYENKVIDFELGKVNLFR